MRGIKNNAKLIDKRIACPIVISNIGVSANSSYISLGPLTGNLGQSGSSSNTLDYVLSTAGVYNNTTQPVFNQPYLEGLSISNVQWNGNNLSGIMYESNNYMGVLLDRSPSTQDDNWKGRVLIFKSSTKTPLYYGNGEIYGRIYPEITVMSGGYKSASWRVNFYYTNNDGDEVMYSFTTSETIDIIIFYVFPFALVPEDFAVRTKQYIITDDGGAGTLKVERLSISNTSLYGGSESDFVAYLNSKPVKFFGLGSSYIVINGFTIHPVTVENGSDGYYELKSTQSGQPPTQVYGVYRSSGTYTYPDGKSNFTFMNGDDVVIYYFI